MLGHELTKRYGGDGLPDDTITDRASPVRPARASARSCPRGITLRLDGDANDYVGKGLSGGRIVVATAASSTVRRRGEHHRRQRDPLRRHGGEVFLRGVVGERFACATPAPSPSSKASATTAAST